MNKTKFLLFLTILLAPLYVIRFQFFSIPTTLLEILIIITVLTWFIENKFSKEEKKVEFVKSSSLNILISLFLIVVALSAFFSPDKRGAIGIFKAYFFEPVIIFFLAKNVIKTKEDLRFIFNALFLSGIWLGVLALIQGFSGQPIFAPHEAVAGRVHGVYNSANALGLYLGPILALSIGFLYKSINPILLTFYLIILTSSIIFSRSAGANFGLLSILATYLLFMIYYLLPRLRKLIKFSIIIFISLFFYFFVYFFTNMSLYTPSVSDPWQRETQDTIQIRSCLWEGAINLLKDRPFRGAGLSGFKELYSEKYYTCDAEPLEYPHNIVLNFWSETGLLGLVSFILLVIYYLRFSGQLSTAPAAHTRKRFGREVNSWAAVGFTAALVYTLIHGLVDVPYFKNDLSIEFWLIYALLIKSKDVFHEGY